MSTPTLQDTIQPKLQDFSRQCQQRLENDPNVIAAYIFGSRAQDYAHPHSDIDVALLVEDRQQVSHRNYFRKLAQINLTLASEIDLVIADKNSPPLLLFQIIKTGQLIYQRSHQERAELEARIMLIYYDTQHIRDIYNYYLSKSIEEEDCDF
jgi:hypothetical protein